MTTNCKISHKQNVKLLHCLSVQIMLHLAIKNETPSKHAMIQHHHINVDVMSRWLATSGCHRNTDIMLLQHWLPGGWGKTILLQMYKLALND